VGSNKGIWDHSSLSAASHVKTVCAVQLPIRRSCWDPRSIWGSEKQRKMVGSVCGCSSF